MESERACMRKQARSVPKAPAALWDWFVALKESSLGQTEHSFRGSPITPISNRCVGFSSKSEPMKPALATSSRSLRSICPPAPSRSWPATTGTKCGAKRLTCLSAAKQALPLEAAVWESLALGNLMVALATARHYAYQSLGALGVAELTTPRSKPVRASWLTAVGPRRSKHLSAILRARASMLCIPSPGNER